MTPASPAVARLAEALAALFAETVPPPVAPATGASATWRERLWTCPAETRLGVVEAAEAVGRSKAFIYRCTRLKELPHRKLDGVLTFKAGELKAWIQQREDIVVRPPR